MNDMKISWIIIGIAIIGLIYGAMTNKPYTIEDVESKKVITFAITGDSIRQKAIEETVAIFERQNNCEIELFKFSSQEILAKKVISHMSAGKSFDVFYTDKVTLDLLAEKEWLINLEEIVVSRKAQGDVFFENTLTYGVVEGAQYALPVGVSPYVIYYNKDIFNTYGVTLPQVLFESNNWNEESFEKSIENIWTQTRKPAFMLDPQGSTLEMFLRMKNILPEERNNSKKMNEIFRDFSDMIWQGMIEYEPANIDYQKSTRLFVTGALPMTIGDLSMTKACHNAPFEWDIIPFPSSTGQYDTSIYKTHLIAGYDGINSELTEKFIEFYISHVGQKYRIEKGDSVIPSLDMTFYTSMGDVTFPAHSNYYFHIIEDGISYNKQNLDIYGTQTINEMWDKLGGNELK